MFYGPLSLTNPVIQTGSAGYGVLLGNYAPGTGSSAINGVPTAVIHPATDFFGNPRPDSGNANRFDIGAIEIAEAGGGGGGTPTLSFTAATNGALTTVAGVRTLTFTIPSPRAAVTSVVTVTNTGTAPLTITAENLLVNIGTLYSVTANTCTTPVAVGGICTFSVRYATPAAIPTGTDVGALAVRNNGTGTIAIPAPPYTPFALVAR